MKKVYKNINTIWITQKEIDKLNKFFEINFDNVKENGDYEQQDLIDELGAKQDDTMGLFTFKFENGKSITIDLDSGSSNYYDNIILWDNDGEEEFVFDCDFEFNSTMEFVDTENNETYICEFTITDK